MALQSSGPISLLDVATEFGGAAPHSLNEYYGKAPGIPASGIIALSDFYGKANEVTLRIYPSSYNGIPADLANAYDGDLNTYTTISTTSGDSIRTSVGEVGSLAAYAEYYVKSLRIYSKFYASSRQHSTVGVYVTNAANIRIGTSSGTIVVNNAIANNTSFPFATTMIHDATANALVNAKVNTLHGYTTSMGLNTLGTNLSVNHGGYDHACRLYEHFYDLTLSGSPPV